MRTIAIITALTLGLAVTGCSKPTQDQTTADIKAAGAKVGDAAKDAVNTPEIKAVGADLKQGAAEAADKAKAATDQAGEKLKAAGEDVKSGAKQAGDDLKK